MENLSKEEIINELETAFAKTLEWVNQQPEENLNKEITAGKWPISHHLYHLVKSTRALNKGLKMPKLALSTMFRKSNRPERTYEAQEKKYKTTLAMTGIKAPANVSAEKGRTFEKNEIFNKFNTALKDLINSLNKWDEKKMSEYVVPHPAIGKCTIREMLYFTISHTYHHLDLMKEKNSLDVDVN